MLVSLCVLFLAFQDDQISQAPLKNYQVADQFSEAIQKYNSVERSESEALFKQVLATLEGRQDMDPKEAIIYTESLKYMGALNYPDQTEAYFEKLIRFDPDHQLNTRDLPPKIVEVYDQLRSRLVGQVKVRVSDSKDGSSLEGAVLTVDGKELGPLFGEKQFSVFYGLHQFEVRCPNYQTYQQSLEVTAGGENLIVASMLRIASQAVIVIFPTGCTASLDGKLVGRATHDVPTSYREQVLEKGLSMEDVGALTIDNLKPGKYTLTMEKPCYRPRTFEFTIGEPTRLNFKPIILEPAEARLTVEAATDNSGLVYLGTERIDFMPVSNHKVCPGTYELRVVFTDGEYLKMITLADGDNLKVLAEPLPSVVWFGLEDDREGKPPGDIDAWVNGLRHWNVRQLNSDDTTKVPVNPYPLLFEQETMDEEGARSLTHMANADLYMAARVVRTKVIIRNVEVAFWSPLNNRIQIRQYDFREFEKFKEQLALMDSLPTLTKPWLGIQIGRLRDLAGARVLEVHEAGPLAGQVKVGETLTAIDGNLVRGPQDLMALTGTGEVTLEIAGRQIKVNPIATIAEMPYSSEHAPQPMLARLDKMARYHPDPLVRLSAQFNLARFQMLSGDYKSAFDIFSTLKIDTKFGINQGTLLFYQGLCFRRLKLTNEANNAFREVLSYPGATLFDAYGPNAAFWAAAEMNNPNL